MFVGSLSKKVCWQMLHFGKLEEWGNVFVGCSGSFRIESVLSGAIKTCRIFSNDVSFLSCAIGHAALGRPFKAQYSGELAFLTPYGGTDALHAIAAAGVALEYAATSANNEYGRQKRQEIIRQAPLMFEHNLDKAKKLVDSLALTDFFPGDFRQQIVRAVEAGGGFIAFAPTYRGGYESQYKVLNENIAWDAPSYEIWDPRNTGDLVTQCETAHIPYLIFSDRLLEIKQPSFFFEGSGHPVYAYGKAPASLRRDSIKVQPFRYKPIDPAQLHQNSAVQIAEVSSPCINFLRSIYLTKGISFKNGMANFLVLIDGMVAGGIIYSQSRYGDRNREVYVLSDFSLRRERRLAKLIAMMSTCRALISILNKRWLVKLDTVSTAVFTNKPVSMKYRGVFKIKNKHGKNGSIYYQSYVREMTQQEIYQLWWDKYGRKS